MSTLRKWLILIEVITQLNQLDKVCKLYPANQIIHNQTQEEKEGEKYPIYVESLEQIDNQGINHTLER